MKFGCMSSVVNVKMYILAGNPFKKNWAISASLNTHFIFDKFLYTVFCCKPIYMKYNTLSALSFFLKS